MWNFRGQHRPDFAVEPGPGQESVWDYPRPPLAAATGALVEIRDGNTPIAKTSRAVRLLETASPPSYYVPRDDVDMTLLTVVAGSSVCEWKGAARYWALKRDPDNPVAWDYPRIRPRYAALNDHLAFYPGRLACFVDGECVLPQPGRFYGGWITSGVVGPFKGEPGTGHW